MKEALISAARLLAVGWVVVLTIGLGLGAGIWVDNLLRTPFPLFTLIGVLLGVVLAFASIYRLVRAVFEPLDKPRR